MILMESQTGEESFWSIRKVCIYVEEAMFLNRTTIRKKFKSSIKIETPLNI